MQKTPEEILSSLKSSFRAILMLIVSIVCFIVFLYAVMAIVRFIAGFSV